MASGSRVAKPPHARARRAALDAVARAGQLRARKTAVACAGMRDVQVRLEPRRFTALVAADNVAVAELARTVGAELVCREPATVVYEVPLVPREEPGYA